MEKKEKITLSFVVSFHVLLIFSLLLISKPKFFSSKKILVKTYVEKKASPLIAQQTSPRKIIKKTPDQKPTQPFSHKKNSIKKKKLLLKKLEIFLGKKENIPFIPQSAQLIVPKEILLVLDSIEQFTENKVQYAEQVISILKNTLTLPNYGKVKIQIQIDKRGKAQLIKIIESESKKNSDYLKNNLPKIQMPCFNDFGLKNLSDTFIITFFNEQ